MGFRGWSAKQSPTANWSGPNLSFFFCFTLSTLGLVSTGLVTMAVDVQGESLSCLYVLNRLPRPIVLFPLLSISSRRKIGGCLSSCMPHLILASDQSSVKVTPTNDREFAQDSSEKVITNANTTNETLESTLITLNICSGKMFSFSAK